MEAKGGKEAYCKQQGYLLFQKLGSYLLTTGLPNPPAVGMLGDWAKAITICLCSSPAIVQETHKRVHSVPTGKPRSGFFS